MSNPPYAATTGSDLPPAVSEAIIEVLLVNLLRDPRSFRIAYGRLEPAHFNRAGEYVYAVLWHETIRYYEQYRRLPNHSVLSAELVNTLQNSAATSPEMLLRAVDLVDWVYGPDNPEESLDPDSARSWIQTLLLDRRVGQPIREAIQASTNPRAIPELLTQMQAEVRQINSLSEQQSGIVVPEVWGEGAPTTPPVPTGISFIDTHMTTYAGDVNVILGPTGVGKTTLGIQMLTETARQQHQQDIQGRPYKFCAYFGYEGDLNDPRIRIISYAAQIRKDRLEHMQTYDDLSTAQNLAPYERELFAADLAAGQHVYGERERLQRVTGWLNRHLKVFDFSGSKGAGRPSQGHGGLAEVREALDQHAQTHSRGYTTVLIDWAGMLVRRQLRAQGKPLDKHLSLELMDFVDRVHSEIALPYECVVYVLHQLRGEIGRRGASAKVTHADAEWCSSFAVNAWFAMCLGNKDEEANACTLSWTKTRRGEGSTLVCKINGAYAQLAHADDEYVLDQASRRIVPRQSSQRPNYTVPQDQQFDVVDYENRAGRF